MKGGIMGHKVSKSTLPASNYAKMTTQTPIIEYTALNQTTFSKKQDSPQKTSNDDLHSLVSFQHQVSESEMSGSRG